MKLLRAILPVVIALSASVAHSQPYEGAWFGSIGGGVAALDYGAFSRRLASYRPLGTSGEQRVYATESFGTTGWSADAGAGVILGKLMIGASGQRLWGPTASSITSPGFPRDEYHLNGGGGGLDLGWALLNDGEALVIPFLQGGLYGWSLDVTNNGTDSLPFFEGIAIEPGGRRSYSGQAPRAALGLIFAKLLGDAAGSPAIVARLAWGTMLSRPTWLEPDGSEVFNGGLTPAYNGVTFSVQIGGGGAWR